MTTIPYLVTIPISVSSNQIGNGSFNVPQNWKLELRSMYAQSTGAFDITNITSNDGTQYSNATQSTPLDGSFFDPTNVNQGDSPSLLPTLLELEGGSSIQVQIKDTSGSTNTVKVMFSGIATY